MGIIDLHCDTIGVLYQKHKTGQPLRLEDSALQIDTNKLIAGDYYAQCFAMFVYYEVENPFEVCIEMIDLFYEELKKSETIRLALTYEDILKNHENQKISALLTIEEGGVTKSNLVYLRTFYRLGVRMICLNWNFENGVGYPNYGAYDASGKPDYRTPNTEKGLTEYGFSMVREMNRLGMIIDVSHLSDKGFWDVIHTTVKPIVASHSNARGVCGHVRNLTDEMIIALHENGGVMGMNYCADFMDDDPKQGENTIACTIRHIRYIKNLVGVDVIALGSDFDGIDPNIELKDASFLPRLVQALREDDFTEEEIDKITYKNALRVFQAVL